jgi:hypothetical protein
VNPYDPCVANLESPRGKQLTVIWHVDNLMAMCEEDFELTKFLCYLAKIYGTKLAMHTGCEHDFLGMDMEFTSKGTLQVSMITYLKNVITGFPEMITRKVATPVADCLFTIQDEKKARLLGQERRTAFHHTVAQLLFISTRARRDIQTAVAFLTTGVKAQDEDDWGKLKRVLKYLSGTKHLKLMLSTEDLGLLKWYVDGLRNVHWDCKGHGGAMFTIGRGSTSSYSRNIKLNTRSLTETELLVADMFMPGMLWSLNFIQGQGCEAECVGLYQDNISSQLLIKNERMSSGRKRKHIKSKFFFIKDKVDKGEIKVIDCPGEKMWTDVSTKPLQGMAFRNMHSKLMNCPVNYDKEKEIEKEMTKQNQ